MQEDKPKVGVGVMILKESKVLILKQSGKWKLPGGILNTTKKLSQLKNYLKNQNTRLHTIVCKRAFLKWVVYTDFSKNILTQYK